MSSSSQGDSTLQGRKIIVGVSGGIAAYKSADLVSKLVQSGLDVQVVMTTAATHFVGTATFQALVPPVMISFSFSDSANRIASTIARRLCASISTGFFPVM